MNKMMGGLILSAILASALSSEAHTSKHSPILEGPHGGQLRTTGPYHLELVAKDGELVLYVSDHSDALIGTDGGMAKATLQLGKSQSRTRIDLVPSRENVFKGTGEFSLSPETVIVIFIKLPDQEAFAARFTSGKPKDLPSKNVRKRPRQADPSN